MRRTATRLPVRRTIAAGFALAFLFAAACGSEESTEPVGAISDLPTAVPTQPPAAAELPTTEPAEPPASSGIIIVPDASDSEEHDLVRYYEEEITAGDILAGLADSYVYRPIERQAEGFTFADQNGDRLSLKDFRGKWVVMDWSYTNCTTVCPDVTADMEKVKNAFADELGEYIQLVTQTLDYRHDHPGALKTFTEEVGLDVPGWTWLAGDSLQSAMVAEAYGVAYAETTDDSGEPMLDHTVLTVVIDPGGRERYHYYGVGWADDLIDRLDDQIAIAVTASETAGPADVPLVGLNQEALEKLAPATSYYWEDWELDPGMITQSAHNFSSSGDTKRYINARMKSLEENGWTNLGEEDEEGEVFGEYYMFQGPDDEYVGVGYNQNVSVETRGEEFKVTLDALFFLGGALCCPD